MKKSQRIEINSFSESHLLWIRAEVLEKYNSPMTLSLKITIELTLKNKCNDI